MVDPQSNDFAGAESVPEIGTETGLAISFDAWQGNNLGDTGDIEGIIIRVDDRICSQRVSPTRHGAADDITSMQTALKAHRVKMERGGDPSLLSAVKVEAELKEDGKLTVRWKGETILEDLQTDFFPSPGRLVFAGRTGGKPSSSC